jgi:hypothetical protein
MNGFDYKKLFSLLFIAGTIYALTRSDTPSQITYKKSNPTKSPKKRSSKKTPIKKGSKKSYPKKRSKIKVAKKRSFKKTPTKRGSKLIRVYRNLNTGTLSAQEKVGGSWKVTDHPNRVKLKNAKFMVNQGGRQRVIKSGQKNVHAYIQGELVGSGSVSGDKVVYDPYKMDSFKAKGKKIKKAKEVSVDSSGNIRAIGLS